MKKLGLVVAILLAITMLVIACAKPAPPPAPAPTPPPAPKPEVIELSLNLAIPPIHTRWTKVIEPWIGDLEKRTEGRIKIVPFFSKALSPSAENYDSIIKGVADIGECYLGAKPERHPMLEQILNCGTPSLFMGNGSKVVMELFNTFPYLQDEMKETKVLFLHAALPVNIGTSKKPVETLADLKGLKLNPHGAGLVVDKLRAFGVSTVGVPMSDVYMSVEKGVVDGSIGAYSLMISRKWGEVIKHITPNVNLKSTVFYMVMNKDLFSGLPVDIQQIIDEMSGDYAVKLCNDFWSSEEMESKQVWEKEMEGKTHYFSPEDVAQMDKLVEPVIEAFVSKMESKGHPFREIYQKFRELERANAVPWPY